MIPNNNSNNTPVVGKTIPDLIDKYPKMSFFLFTLIIILVVGLIVFIWKSGGGLNFGDVKVTQPTESQEKNVKKPVIKEDDGKDEQQKEAFEKLETKQKQCENLKRRLPYMQDSERRITENNIRLIEIEIEDIEKVLKK